MREPTRERAAIAAPPVRERAREPDPNVLRKARLGEEHAFAEIVRQYQSRLFAYILRSVREPGLAEELTQDVFVRAYHALPRFLGTFFTSWLYRIATNRVIDEMRARACRAQPLNRLDGATSLAVTDRMLELADPLESIWSAIAALDVELRVPLLLREIAGLSYAEIAQTLSLPLSTVKWRIHFARGSVVNAIGEQHAPAPSGAGAGCRQGRTASARHAR